MADTGKRVEVRFGAFACAIEGYDDPVVQMREVFTLMQQMIRETPALADRASQFGDAEVARLEHALDHSGGHGDAAPGIVVIRGAAVEPEDAETVDDLPPEAAGEDEAEPVEGPRGEPFGEAGQESGFPGDQPTDDGIAADEVVATAHEDNAPAEPGAAGAETPEGSEPRPVSDSKSGTEAAGESAPGAEASGAESGHEPEAPARFSGPAAAGADGGREPSETDAHARDRLTDDTAAPAAGVSAAAAAEAAFLADIAAAVAPSDEQGGTVEDADDTAPEPGAAEDEATTVMAGERNTASGLSDDAASAGIADGHPPKGSEAAELLESAERDMDAESLEVVDGQPETAERDDGTERPESVETAVGPEPSEPPVETLEDALAADEAFGTPGDAEQADARETGSDASPHDAREADRAVVSDAAPELAAMGDEGQERPATLDTGLEQGAIEETGADQLATGEVGAEEPASGETGADQAAGEGGEAEQVATGEAQPEQAASEEADPVGAAIAASVAGAGGFATPDSALADSAAGVAGHDGEHPSPATARGGDRAAFNIFAPPPAGGGPQRKGSVNLFAPPPAHARPRDGAFVNIFAAPRASAAREPAFAGSGPAPAADRATRPGTRAASLLDPVVTEAGLAPRQNVFAPGLDEFEEPDAGTPSPGLFRRPEARAADVDRVAPEANADPAPAPRRPESTGRFAALLGRIYGSRGGGVPEAPSDAARPTTYASAAADPVGRAKGTSAPDLAARAGARSVPDLLAASAAWLALVDDKRRFSRREVMEVFDSLPGPHERTLEARIKGFGKLVRAGILVLVEEGVFSLSDAESDRYRELLDRG